MTTTAGHVLLVIIALEELLLALIIRVALEHTQIVMEMHNAHPVRVALTAQVGPV